MIRIFSFILLFVNGTFYNIRKNIKYTTKLLSTNNNIINNNYTIDKVYSENTNFSIIHTINKDILSRKINEINRINKLLGYDDRNYTEINKLEGNIEEITINFEKLNLLKLLDDKNINNIDKINIINNNIYLFNNDKSSILNGGLYDDWNFDF